MEVDTATINNEKTCVNTDINYQSKINKIIGEINTGLLDASSKGEFRYVYKYNNPYSIRFVTEVMTRIKKHYRDIGFISADFISHNTKDFRVLIEWNYDAINYIDMAI